MGLTASQYVEHVHHLGADGASGLHVLLTPAARRKPLTATLATQRVLAACTGSLGLRHPWHVNFDLQFQSGALVRWPRKFGVPVERLVELLEDHSVVELALRTHSDSDAGEPGGGISAVQVRIFLR